MKLLLIYDKIIGGLAQLARAPALHAGGHRFDSDILHFFLNVLHELVKFCNASNRII